MLCLDLGYKLSERVQDLTRDQINFLMASRKIRGQDEEIARDAAEGISTVFLSGED